MEQTVRQEEKKAILAVSFGTSYQETREKTIGAIEDSIKRAYPEYEVRRAFTSRIILRKLKERDGIEIDDVEQALKRLAEDGYQTIVVQPTYVMGGEEYHGMRRVCAGQEKLFASISYGDPLLSRKEDFHRMAEIMAAETAGTPADTTAVVWLGHGTEHEANRVYEILYQTMLEKGYQNHYIGTVEATPDQGETIGRVRQSGAVRVVLIPLMIVAGDHAVNDMAGSGENSWKRRFEDCGYQVDCVMKGLGEYEGVRDLFVSHIKDAI